jgi:hypothetical protein
VQHLSCSCLCTFPLPPPHAHVSSPAYANNLALAVVPAAVAAGPGQVSTPGLEAAHLYLLNVAHKLQAAALARGDVSVEVRQGGRGRCAAPAVFKQPACAQTAAGCMHVCVAGEGCWGRRHAGRVGACFVLKVMTRPLGNHFMCV